MAGVNKIPLLVVGGGIGGLATALAIAKIGRPVHVIERASQFAEIGAGLQLGPNASRVLDCLGLIEEIYKCAVFPTRLALNDALAGERLTTLELNEKFLEKYRYRYLVVHRGDLLEAELKACFANNSITLETSRDVIRVEDRCDFVRVECADGSIYECDALIGADGLHSVVRQSVVDHNDPIVCSQFVAYRGTVPIEAGSKHAGLNDMTIWCGPNMHLVEYPIRRSELLNQVAVFKSARFREDSDDWGANEELETVFSQACDYVRNGLATVRRDRCWPMADREPICNWTRNRITLLGDAAHPVLQYLAQGACQALEDAICLAQSLKRFHPDIPRAFLNYQEQRIPRTTKINRSARIFGEFIHVQGICATLRRDLMARRAPDDFSPVDWLYSYQPHFVSR